jgi:hypothetical protein
VWIYEAFWTIAAEHVVVVMRGPNPNADVAQRSRDSFSSGKEIMSSSHSENRQQLFCTIVPSVRSLWNVCADQVLYFSLRLRRVSKSVARTQHLTESSISLLSDIINTTHPNQPELREALPLYSRHFSAAD